MSAARLIARPQVGFKTLGGYHSAIEELNDLRPRRGFIWREYSPASARFAGIDRRYFTGANASKIDAIRSHIGRWRDSGMLSDPEHALLIADLLSATNRVANIAGTYGCFLSKWTPQSQCRIELRPRILRETPVEVIATTTDVSNVLVQKDDCVYLDPPYTKRQYASYYHILETITLADRPLVEGVSGLRPWRDRASAFCYKKQALVALRSLIASMPASRILLSYSAEGHIPIRALKASLSEFGLVHSHAMMRLGRYRPNKAASRGAEDVKEYLFILQRDIAALLKEARA
jgi:adenine-specific DNA-methyltransferase